MEIIFYISFAIGVLLIVALSVELTELRRKAEEEQRDHDTLVAQIKQMRLQTWQASGCTGNEPEPLSSYETDLLRKQGRARGS